MQNGENWGLSRLWNVRSGCQGSSKGKTAFPQCAGWHDTLWQPVSCEHRKRRHAAQPAGGDSADKNMWSARGAVLQPGTHAGRKCGTSAGQPQAAALPGRILTHRRRCHWRCLTNPWTGKRARVCLIVMHGHWEDAKASSYFFAFCGQNGGIVVS